MRKSNAGACCLASATVGRTTLSFAAATFSPAPPSSSSFRFFLHHELLQAKASCSVAEGCKNTPSKVGKQFRPTATKETEEPVLAGNVRC